MTEKFDLCDDRLFGDKERFGRLQSKQVRSARLCISAFLASTAGNVTGFLIINGTYKTRRLNR